MIQVYHYKHKESGSEMWCKIPKDSNFWELVDVSEVEKGESKMYKFTEKQVLEAISGTGGVVSLIAKRLGDVSWSTAKLWIDKFETAQEALKIEQEKVLDIGEIALIDQVKAGEQWAIKFLLATKGRTRGYNERVELANADNEAFKIENSDLIKELSEEVEELKTLKLGKYLK